MTPPTDLASAPAQRVQLDELSNRIVSYLTSMAFETHYALACTADISRHVGQNPRTVQHRLRQLIDNKVLNVVDSYPRIGRSMICIYKIDFSVLER